MELRVKMFAKFPLKRSWQTFFIVFCCIPEKDILKHKKVILHELLEEFGHMIGLIHNLKETDFYREQKFNSIETV